MTAEPASAPLAFDDIGSGRLVLMLPGAGDVRSEYRFLVEPVAAAGYRVVAADLPGHGDSPIAAEYTVASAAAAIQRLIADLDGGPVVIVANSFAPAAAVWLAAEHPGSVAAVVAISPHLDEDASLKGRFARALIRVLLRGPWAGMVWKRLYSGWYKAVRPDDLDGELSKIGAMLGTHERRRAVRDTLTAGRAGVAERVAALTVPTLTIFGSADDHFADPASEARRTAGALGGEFLLIEGAGHYPHVERPEQVAPAVIAFLRHLEGG